MHNRQNYPARDSISLCLLRSSQYERGTCAENSLAKHCMEKHAMEENASYQKVGISFHFNRKIILSIIVHCFSTNVLFDF